MTRLTIQPGYLPEYERILWALVPQEKRRLLHAEQFKPSQYKPYPLAEIVALEQFEPAWFDTLYRHVEPEHLGYAVWRTWRARYELRNTFSWGPFTFNLPGDARTALVDAGRAAALRAMPSFWTRVRSKLRRWWRPDPYNDLVEDLKWEAAVQLARQEGIKAEHLQQRVDLLNLIALAELDGGPEPEPPCLESPHG